MINYYLFAKKDRGKTSNADGQALSFLGGACRP